MSEGGRTLLATSIIVLAGIAAFGWATRGFRVLTSEAARRVAVIEQPVVIPDAGLRASLAGMESLRGALADDGRVVLVDFVYTRCRTLCTALGNEYQQLQRAIRAEGVQDRVRLLSISFDPAHDSATVLQRHASGLRADPAIWRFATIPDPAELATQLDAFGIVAIPDGMGGYAHNAAIHVVTPDGRLQRIRDLGQWRQALRDALAVAP